MSILERASQPLPRPPEMARSLSRDSLTNGIVAFLFATTGPLAILLTVATTGRLSEADISSWIFVAYGGGGVLSILFSICYRQPIAIAWTIPGAVLLGTALDHLSFAEVIGAYVATGLLIGVLGVTGWIGRVMSAIPMPIVMGMVAGVFLPLGLNVVLAFGQAFWLAFWMVAAFVMASIAPGRARNFPPVLAALVVGALVAAITDNIHFDEPLRLAFAEPKLYRPALSIQAMLELVLPLAVTVIGIQNAQGFFILRSAGYEPPQNVLTIACGLGSLAFGALGSVPTCVTGPANAILNASGLREHRYLGAVVFGILMALFGLFAPVTTSLGLALPAAFIGMLGGLALLGVLQNTFVSAFTGQFTLGALISFLVTISDVTILNIGAAFWGLAFGCAVSWLFEAKDFQSLREIGRKPS